MKRSSRRWWTRLCLAVEALRRIGRRPPGWITGPVTTSGPLPPAAWIVVTDPGTRAFGWARAALADAIAAAPGTDLVTGDLVITDSRGRFRTVVARPAFDPVMLGGCDVVSGVVAVRRSAAEAALSRGPLDPSAPTLDLALRVLSGRPDARIRHVTVPLGIGTEDATVARAPAVSALLARHLGSDPDPAGVSDGTPLLRPRLGLSGADWPRIAVILPTRDQPALLDAALRGLRDLTDYPALTLVIVDNRTVDPDARALIEAAAARGGRVVRADYPFNFSRMVNDGAAAAPEADAFLLLNNDVVPLARGWLREMVACAVALPADIVGARLLYPDGRLQHAGVRIGLGGTAGHPFKGLRIDAVSPAPLVRVRRRVSAVTAACMLVRRRCWDRLGGFDPAFAVAYNDVDFCLRARALGFDVVWTPFADLTHHESRTRGKPRTAAERHRFAAEKRLLRQRHGTRHARDPMMAVWPPADRG